MLHRLRVVPARAVRIHGYISVLLTKMLRHRIDIVSFLLEALSAKQENKRNMIECNRMREYTYGRLALAYNLRFYLCEDKIS